VSFKKELLDELLKNYKKPEDLFGENGVFNQFKKAIVERALETEMSQHLGYEKNKQFKSLEITETVKTQKK